MLKKLMAVVLSTTIIAASFTGCAGITQGNVATEIIDTCNKAEAHYNNLRGSGVYIYETELNGKKVQLLWDVDNGHCIMTYNGLQSAFGVPCKEIIQDYPVHGDMTLSMDNEKAVLKLNNQSLGLEITEHEEV